MLLSQSSNILKCVMTLIIGIFLSYAAQAAPLFFKKQKLAILPKPTFTDHKLPILTLRDAVLLALRNNPTVKSSELQRVVDKFTLAVARNQFEPQYQLTGQANYANGSRPGYNYTPQVSLTTPYGTQLSTNVSNSWDGSGNGSSVATATLQQPLLRGFGRKIVEAQLYTAIQQEKVNQLTLKSSIISVILSVTQAYYQLVQDYNTLVTNELNLQNSKETLRQTIVRIQAGQAPGTDRVVQETDVASALLNIEGNKNTILQDQQNLITLLGLDPDVKISIDKQIHVDNVKLPTLEKAIQIGLANNIEYQQALLNYKVTERNLLVAQNQQKWDLELSANVSRTLFATGTESVNTGSNSTTTTTTTTGTTTTTTTIVNGFITNPGTTSGGSATTKSLTLSLNVPIDNFSIKQQLVNARVSLKQAQLSLENSKRQLITQVTNNYHSLLSQLEQIKLAEKNVALAQQSLNIEILKYNSGRSTSINVTTQRNNLTNAQLTLISQKITYLNTLETFFQTLGTTLEKWNVSLTY